MSSLCFIAKHFRNYKSQCFQVGLILFVLSGSLGCGAESKSEKLGTVSVIGGLAVGPDEYPEVVRIYQGFVSCSASFVSSQTILTAAHCLEDGGAVRVTTETGTHTTNNYALHPGYAQRWWEHDLAVIHFNMPVTSNFATVAPSAPKAGDNLTIVGFGTDNLYGQGVMAKRKGQNQVVAVGLGRITFIGKDIPENAPPGEDVLNAPGDSGGPMFVEGKQVGVSSSISVGQRGQRRNGYYTDLHYGPNMAFLKKLESEGRAVVTY